MARAGRSTRTSRFGTRIARRYNAQTQTLGDWRIGRGVAKIQLGFFTDLTPSLQGNGHGVHHLDGASIGFTDVVVRGHRFILGQGTVGKTPRCCRHRGGGYPKDGGWQVYTRHRSLNERISLTCTPPTFGTNDQYLDLLTKG